MNTNNRDDAVVAGFGQEWKTFTHSIANSEGLERNFADYFAIFPWDKLPAQAKGFDIGCGSGRWARFVAPKVGELHCIDASDEALTVARSNLQGVPQAQFHLASVDAIPLPDDSMDFGYSLGVLHHVPDTTAGLATCVRKLRRGAPFLVYLYYAFDNRPAWFRGVWRVSDMARRLISSRPFWVKRIACEVLALMVYWPLARLALLGERAGRKVGNWPLSAYRQASFYVMRNDSLDRFGTKLEQRFTRAEIEAMMQRAGLDQIQFSEAEPYWCAVGYKQ
ncbi:MAG: class I SAM-dependent methyltransferase [Opitutae bacterium]|nr:class I SAM-dependent methyltransferase [Opitutae bacterium]